LPDTPIVVPHHNTGVGEVGATVFTGITFQAIQYNIS
jgi:hypothetical protein